jgi:hypothetical protein
MRIKEINERHGRPALIIASILIWIWIIWSFFNHGYIQTWELWHIPAELPPFLDFRLIPSGAETFRSGIDPAVSNPNDPWNHLFNYPKIWYIFFYTGITQDDTIRLSILIIALFFLTVFSFAEKLHVTDAFLMLAVVFSPAAMLLYERGNLDLAFFILCGLAVLLLERFPGWTVFVLLIAGVFKFFPILGAGIFLQDDRKRSYKYLFITAGIFIVYIILSFESVVAAWELTMRSTYLSYGAAIIFELLDGPLRHRLLNVLSEGNASVVLKWLPHLSAVVFLAFLFWLGTKKKDALQVQAGRNLTAFRMGTLIYVGTFLLGNNWDYRLAFLIFTIPQLSQWIFALRGIQRWLVIGVFICLLLTCWFIFIDYEVILAFGYAYELELNIVEEVINWMLFGGLTYLFCVSAPNWFRTFSWFPSFQGNEGGQP